MVRRVCFRCACAEGYTGPSCEDDLDECSSDSACLHGATCLNTVGSYACICPGDYAGRRCETDMHRCRSSPCRNHGACVDLPNGFRCDCRRGFAGLLCEADVDECATAPCVIGLCVNEVITLNQFSNYWGPRESGYLISSDVNKRRCGNQFESGGRGTRPAPSAGKKFFRSSTFTCKRFTN